MSPSSASNRRRAVFFGLLAMLLVACTSPDGEPPAPSATPSPAKTLPPTATRIQIPTATKTPIPTATASATDIPAPSQGLPEESDLIAAVQAAADQRSIWHADSEDSAWSLEIVRFECVQVEFNEIDQLAYEELRVIEPNGAVITVDYQLQYCGGLGAYGLNGLFFSPDGRSFYYNEAREGVPDGAPCGYWFKGTSRVNLETLETERLPGEGPLSPNGEQMLLWGRKDFVHWDLNTGELGRANNPFENYNALSIEFNQDGTLAAILLREDCFSPEAGSALLLLDLPEMTSRIVLEASNPGYVQAAWESDGTLILQDFNGDFFILTLSSGEISPQE